MKVKFLFSLTLFLILVFSLDSFSSTHAIPSKLLISNFCHFTIWPGIHTLSGKNIHPSGFSLEPKAQIVLPVELPWAGKVWGRTNCSQNGNTFHCKAGDCGSGQERCYGKVPQPPVSKVDLNMAPNGGRSFYSIDLIDGANVRLNVVPMDTRCGEIQCYVDLKQYCPDWLTKFDENGARIGCKSACMVTGLPQHCCTGAFADPDKCMLNPYSEFVSHECPNAMTYRFQNKNFSCFGGVGFGIYFCG